MSFPTDTIHTTDYGSHILVILIIHRLCPLLESSSLWGSDPTATTNKLLSLNPFLGSDGLIHIEGHLSKAPIPEAQRHPILLSSHDLFTELLFSHYHVKLSHCGPTLLLSHAGEIYHILGVRRLARKICSQCVPCRKVSAKAQNQMMGQLPPSRVTPDHTFNTTGIDYAGPFLLKRGMPRKPQIVKAYMAIFVCFATKAVHLEVVSDQTTEAFLAALKRFCSRRGRPHSIHTDNGSNFIGARNNLLELTKLLMAASTSASVHSYLLEGKTEWHCIPERAPHFGGLWEAAIKSTKLHLKRVVGDQKLDFEEMTTVATQVKACLNSRPLGYLYSHSPDAVVPLTPGHFINGRSLQAYPELAIERNMSLCRRWVLCQAMVQAFWKRWSKEYLQQLQAAQKWRTPQPNLTVDDLVLLTDGNYFQTHWTMARVVAVYPGEDQLVRAVDVRVCAATAPSISKDQTQKSLQPKIKTSVLRRPVSKLVRLLPEISDRTC